MAHVQLADGVLNYQLDGPADAPVLVLSNSLGTDLGMWDSQIPLWSEHFRVLRYDTRGHGASLVTEGPYNVEQLGRDVLALLDALDIQKAHFVGLSMGGLIGQWLGINAYERLNRLIVCNTSAKIGSPEVWNPRIETVLRDREAAMVGLRDASIARWFTPAFAAARMSSRADSEAAALLSAEAPAINTAAQAVPSGYLSTPCSFTISARRRGIIIRMPSRPPSTATSITRVISRSKPRMRIAGIVAPMPNAIDSPAEPAVCAMLFSRIEASRPPTFDQPRNSASEITATGIEALTVSPTLSTR